MAMIRRIGKRLRMACCTNDVQVKAVALLSLVTLFALRDCGWRVLLGLTLWPSIAFLFNVIDPIPKDDR